MDALHDVIAAFADDEAVDPAALKQALATAEGRDALIDVLVLRGMFGAPATARSAPQPAVRATGVLRRWLTIAALVALGAAGGFAIGVRRAPLPAPNVIVDNAAPTPDSGTVTPAPAPTRVIHLRTGVDWREQQGGGD